MKTFTCQNRKEFSISIEKLIIISGVFVCILMFGLVIYVGIEAAHESYDECNNLITGVYEAAGIVRNSLLGGSLYHDETAACTKYVDENPNATGQDVLDHLNLKIRTVEEIIDGPINNNNLLDSTNIATKDITGFGTNLPYYKECVELGSGADISVLECMSVVADNPSYTGQEIIDAVELNKNTQVDKSNILDRTLRP